MTQTLPTTHEPRPFGARWNWRVVGMLALFAAVIAASVVTADIFATRDRTPSTQPTPSLLTP